MWGRGLEGQLGMGEKKNLYEPFNTWPQGKFRNVFCGGNSTFLLDCI